tara:strand:- start:668 stop:1372 length:705 start_codon:yes stop_codon:yes gene_type:complete
MSDKKMLNETTIRKMMKLANIPALTDNFIKENYFDYSAVTEEEHEELDVELPAEDPMDGAMEEPEMDLDVDIDEPAGDDLPAAEELVQDLMGVLEKHFEDVEFNVEVEGDEELMDEPEMDLDEPMDDEPMGDEPMGDEPMGDEPLAMDDEEEPMMETELEETDLEEGDSQAATDLPYTQSPDEEGAAAEVAADEAFMEGELEEMEDDGAHSKLIDAIAAKVAERLLAEAKKTNK